MKELKRTGLDGLIPELTQPFLGVCLGMQLLADQSEEDDVECLGIIPGLCRRFPTNLKLPHLGWNLVEMYEPTQNMMTKFIKNNEYYYFLNSYYFDAEEPYIIARTPYGFRFPSIVCKDNFYATQFHPEKSGVAGELLLKSWLRRASCI